MTHPSALTYQVDLFGEILPAVSALRSPRGRRRSAEADLAALREDVERVLDDLRRNIEEAISDLEFALDHVDDGEKDLAIEHLDAALDAALAAARREMGVD